MKAFHLILVLAALSTPGWGDVLPPPKDSCIDKKEGAACVPARGPPGKCTWVDRDGYEKMEIHTQPNCEGTLPAVRCLLCVSEVYRGDRHTVRQRAASLVASGELVGAYMALEYLDNLGECDPEVARLWFRLGKAQQQAQPGVWSGSRAFVEAKKCDPSLPIRCDHMTPCKVP
jgi:hypothetical protein